MYETEHKRIRVLSRCHCCQHYLVNMHGLNILLCNECTIPSFCIACRFTNSITSSMRLYYESGVEWPNFMQQYCKVGNIVVISPCVSVPDAFS